MSPVSPESPRPSADLTAQANGRSGAQEPSAPPGPGEPRRPTADRGPGETERAGQAGQGGRVGQGGQAGETGRVTQPQVTATSTDFGPNAWLEDDVDQPQQAHPGSAAT